MPTEDDLPVLLRDTTGEPDQLIGHVPSMYWNAKWRWVPMREIDLPTELADVPPPFPARWREAGWRPLSELEDYHTERVLVAFERGGEAYVNPTSLTGRSTDEKNGRIAWQPFPTHPEAL